MNLSIIAALANSHVIGKSNTIPWCLPEDMMWFKYHTLGKVVIMGRKTFGSIGNKALPNRLNLVLSRKNVMNEKNTSSVVFVRTLEEVFCVVRKIYGNDDSEVMIIGGGEIYNIFFLYANRLYLTYIDIDIQGDTFFPDYEKNEWKSIFNKHHNCNLTNHVCTFQIFERL